ncbi:MAG TPA: CocE/NonD family hydrolase [Acidimicrobiia bacterium]|nr:CocE/NonD family hydrolase [Acidimicrobiia bacterium]
MALVEQRVELLTERSVMIPMRDGVRLAADLWRPDTDEPVPVLVARTPYNRAMLGTLAAEVLAKAGYAVLQQDCRGRFESEGEGWCPVELDADDGYDTVEWAAAQPWSNGKVGMFGASYMGYVQWQAAIARPPSLVAILPETAAADYWDPIFGPGGAFRVANRVGWTLLVAMEEARRQAIDDPLLDELREGLAALAPGDIMGRAAVMTPVVERLMWHRPLRDIPFFARVAPWYADYFVHDRRDDPSWLRSNPRSHYTELDLPAIHIGGWYDVQLSNTLLAYEGMRDRAATDEARAGQRMIIGPWTHWGITVPVVGDIDFGPSSVLDIDALRLGWFDHWMRDTPSSVVDDPPVRVFVMGDNEWRDEHEWPLARTQWTPWYLHADGGFGPEAPTGDDGPDAFTYDPHDPVPTLGGRLLGTGGARGGPVEQGDVATRADVLAYTSGPLPTDLEITGPVRAELWASTSAPDTDFTAKLVDVHPDGRSYNICDGIVRARTQFPIPLVAGATYCFTVDLAATSIVVPAGHRLQLQVSSSNFPMFEANANTGLPAGTDTADDLRVAEQRVFHDAHRPSRIVLPVVPR